jgi:uncharacterized protein
MKQERLEMNRRHRNKQQGISYVSVVQDKWAQLDFKALLDSVRTLWLSLPRLHQSALMILVPLVGLITIIPFPHFEANESTSPKSSRIEVGLDITPLGEVSREPQTGSEKSASSLVRSAWISYTVQNGDTLSQIFRSNNLPLSDLNTLISIEGEDKPLSSIRPGQLIRYKLNNEDKLDILQLERSGQSIMFFRLSEGGFGRSR